MRSLFGQDSVYMLLWVLQLLGAAALTPLMTRLMNPHEFGGVAASNAAMQVLFVLAGLGLQTAIQRQYARESGPDEASRLLTMSILLAVLVTVVAYVTAGLWGRPLGFGPHMQALRLALLWAGTAAVTNSALGLLRSQERLLAFSAVSLIQSVVAEATSLVLLVTLRPTAEMFVLGQLLAQLAAVALSLALTRPAPLRRRDQRLAAMGLAFALPLVPAVLGTFVLGAGDRLIVQANLGIEAVARYQVCYNIGSAPMLLLSVLHTAWLPRFFALENGGERAVVLQTSREALYQLLAPVIVGLSLGAPLVLSVWAPKAYRTNELLLMTAVIIISAVPYTAGLCAIRRLLLDGRTTAIAVGTVVAAGVNVLLNLALVPVAGLLGSAVATLLAYGLLHLLLLQRVATPHGWRRWHIGTASGTVRCLTGMAAALLAAEIPASGNYLAVRAVLAVACLAWFVFVLHQISTKRWTTSSAVTA